MLFSSMSFVFAFLPLVLLLYYLCHTRRARNGVLLLASIVFYGWGEPKYLLVMLISMILTWGAGLLIARGKRKLLWLVLTVLLDLGILIYFKYTNFLLENISAVLNHQLDPIHVVMPIGISFYTFQAISYLVDVYRGDVQVQKNLYKVMLYISLFPQLVAGPIVKYHDIALQIDGRKETLSDFSLGLRRFIVGLSKKMLIANTMGAVADKIFTLPVEQFDPSTAWIGAIAYAFQIYYDFSGYSDMAIGLCLMFGFRLPENFNYPYISASITEFWRRWHISLSTWFKEYLYIPLGGNRVSKKRNLFNLFVVFLATGIWHGASWNFVVWGLWHGLFIIVEKVTGWHRKQLGWFLNSIRHISTLMIVLIGWVFFRADSFAYGCDYVANMFGLVSEAQSYAPFGYFMDRFSLLMLVVAIALSMPWARNMIRVQKMIPGIAVDFWLVFLFLCSWTTIAASTYNPFIYFRF